MRLSGQFPLLGGVLLLLTTAALAAEELHTVAEVRGLTVEEAQLHNPVKLRGVVTFFDETLFSRFVQDDTAGIYLWESTNTPTLVPGQIVEVEGTASPGEYAPIIVPERVRVVGEGQLPNAKVVTYERLASGKEDSQFVEIAGIVRSVRSEPDSQHHLIEIATGGGRLLVYAKVLPVAKPDDLVDSTVRVRGVCSTLFNRQRQLFAIRMMVPRPDDLLIEIPATQDAIAIPARGIGSLMQFTPEETYGHRVKIAATVIYQDAGNILFLQDGQEGLQVYSKQTNALQLGDRIEALGFPAQGEYTPILQDAVYRKISSGKPPEPAVISQDEALKGTYDCRLVRLSAKLLDRAHHSREQFLVLEADNYIFHAYLQQGEGSDAFSNLENGSRVSVTGVCLIEPGEWQAGENWRAKSFRILLRSSKDITVLQLPPWWSLKKVLWISGILGLVALAAFSWVAVLRRRVQKQTGIIREQLQVEAALKERYVDLFENANDMVFTHDLSGKVTSVNETGERLLQRNRKGIISRNLLDLIAEDQRNAAHQWLEQVIAGADLAPAEWDFVNTAGHRVKLEISSRLIGQNGHKVEVEGVARDVTERRRLERELLEVSNREQRRIGHDLHDGICQQLAGIAYLVDILGDKLGEKAAAESAEAEKIGGMINEVTAQARSVARGLFPVRLDENGLISAIEELADSASSRFKVNCRFSCDHPPHAVDNEVALHLYYIAQEATLNAVRHGKAANVNITLTPEGSRCRMTIQDDGRGFHAPATNRAGMGIRIMRYRAKVIGASLDLASQAGSGTQISCVFSPEQREPLQRNGNNGNG
jgi:PAS domain S-box-containing protein